ncbi:MAG: hypothetical protein ABI147_01980 [Acidobacteriaceae bacterium]
MIHGFLGLLKDLPLFGRRRLRQMPNVRDHLPGVLSSATHKLFLEASPVGNRCLPHDSHQQELPSTGDQKGSVG